MAIRCMQAGTTEIPSPAETRLEGRCHPWRFLAEIWTESRLHPKEITALLRRQVVQNMLLPDMRERMAALGFQVIGNSPEGAAAYFRTEGIRWAKVIRDAGIKAH
jgi:hypothetical protein